MSSMPSAASEHSASRRNGASDSHAVASAEPRVLVLSGRLDASAGQDLNQTISALQAEGHAVVVNLAKVHYVSSSILRVFLKAHRRARQSSGLVVLCCLQPQVLRVFSWIGFDQVLTICTNEEEARRVVALQGARHVPGVDGP